MFEVVRLITMDPKTLETEYDVISRHKTKASAQRAFEKIARREVCGLRPHEISPSDVANTGLDIRKV